MLRGLPGLRCPECGLTFTAEELASGLLRENRATWLDGVDSWRPVQVLIRSAYEFMRGIARPRRLLLTVDVNGPIAPAVLMLVCGIGWLWLLTGALAALGVWLHTDTSPAAALRAGLLLWGPLATGTALFAMAGPLLLILRGDVMRVARPTRRQRWRLGCYAAPMLAAYACLPAACSMCLLAEMNVLVLVMGAWLSLMVAAMCVLPRWRWEIGAAVLAVCVCWVALAAVVCAKLMWGTLVPPWWVYGL
jgi:hypothetical protein